jgi:hypothetical protein
MIEYYNRRKYCDGHLIKSISMHIIKGQEVVKMFNAAVLFHQLVFLLKVTLNPSQI